MLEHSRTRYYILLFSIGRQMKYWQAPYEMWKQCSDLSPRGNVTLVQYINMDTDGNPIPLNVPTLAYPSLSLLENLELEDSYDADRELLLHKLAAAAMSARPLPAC